MKLASLLVLKELIAGGNNSVSRLAAKFGVFPSTISRAFKELKAKGLVEIDGRSIFLASNSMVHEFKLLSSKFDVEKIFLESKEKLVLELIEPKTFPELQKSLNLSSVQVSKLLKELMETGAVFKKDDRFELNERLKTFALELKKTIDARRVESTAIIIFSNTNFLLKKLPLSIYNEPTKYEQALFLEHSNRLGITKKEAKTALVDEYGGLAWLINKKKYLTAKGSLTAFSKFAEFGVQYSIINDFFVEPEHDVLIEEILVHALVACESKKDMAMCLIFYEKNKEQMDLKKLVDFSKEFNVLGLFLDCLAFLGKKTVVNTEKFLPWLEFWQLAQNYGVGGKFKEKFSKNELELLLSEIGKALDKPLDVFLIGGCNLSLQGIKAATKDIDLVVKDKKDFEAFENVVKKIGFKQVSPQTPAYKKMNPNAIFEKKGKPRIDVFTKIVCNALSLSNQMINTAVEQKHGRLSVKFVKPEDIILFKAITERENDLEDIAAIIRTQKLDWNFFLKELDNQYNQSQRLFCLDVLVSIEILEKKEKIVIPIKQKLLSLCLEKAILFLAKNPISVQEILQKVDFPETSVRNKIVRLVKEKNLKKICGKPFKVVV